MGHFENLLTYSKDCDTFFKKKKRHIQKEKEAPLKC